MAIVKYVPDHKEPQNTIRYIAKAGKTKNGELVTGINTSEDPENAVSQFAFMFEHFSGRRFDVRTDSGAKQEVRLHHYVQSFKPDEVSPEQTHKIGVEWAKRCSVKSGRFLSALTPTNLIFTIISSYPHTILMQRSGMQIKVP